MKKVCKCLYDAIFASLQTLERECRSPGGVAFALPSVIHTLRFPVLRTAAEIGCFRYPGVSLSLFPRLLPRLSFGELKVPTPCFHELCTRLGVVAGLYHHISGAFSRCAQFQNVNVRQIYGMSKRIDTPMAVIVFFFDFLVWDNKISPL